MQFFLAQKTPRKKRSLCELHKIPAKNSIDIELVFPPQICGIFGQNIGDNLPWKTSHHQHWIFPHINPGKKFLGLSAFYRNLRSSPISKWDPILTRAVSFLFLYEVPVCSTLAFLSLLSFSIHHQCNGPAGGFRSVLQVIFALISYLDLTFQFFSELSQIVC